jgi:hypothetical protein
MTKNNKNNAQVRHFDLYGRRDDKYACLSGHELSFTLKN